MRFVGAILHQIRLDPEAPAFHFPDSGYGPADYAGLERMTRSIAGRLGAHGIGRGKIIALDLANEHLHAAFIVAALRCGIVTLSAARGAIPKSVPVAAVFTDRETGSAKPDGAIAVTGEWLDGADSQFAFAELNPDDLCRVMLTSGSTGEPKATFLTFAMVRERLDSYAFAFGRDFAGATALMCGMKLSSSLGFGFLLHCLARGGFYCSDSAKYETIARAIAAFGIRALVISPATIAEILAYRAEHGETGMLADCILTAGSRISPELEEAVRARLCRELTVFYGTTETGVIAVRRAPGSPGNVGYVAPGKIVDILTPEGEPAPAGVSGRVRIRDISRRLPFRDSAAQAAGKWIEEYFPGDTGELDSAGRLVIHGREDMMINSGGVKISPEILEQIIAQAPGIRDCAVMAERDRLGVDRITAYLVLRPGWRQDRFLQYCEGKIARDFLPAKFVSVAQIPRTHNGKIDRQKLPELQTR